MWHHGMGMGGGVSGYGILGYGLNLIILIAVIFLVVRLFQSRSVPPPVNRDKQDSLSILKQRLANGDISEEEYHRIKNILDGN